MPKSTQKSKKLPNNTQATLTIARLKSFLESSPDTQYGTLLKQQPEALNTHKDVFRLLDKKAAGEPLKNYEKSKLFTFLIIMDLHVKSANTQLHALIASEIEAMKNNDTLETFALLFHAMVNGNDEDAERYLDILAPALSWQEQPVYKKGVKISNETVKVEVDPAQVEKNRKNEIFKILSRIHCFDELPIDSILKNSKNTDVSRAVNHYKDFNTHFEAHLKEAIHHPEQSDVFFNQLFSIAFSPKFGENNADDVLDFLTHKLKPYAHILAQFSLENAKRFYREDGSYEKLMCISAVHMVRDEYIKQQPPLNFFQRFLQSIWNFFVKLFNTKKSTEEIKPTIWTMEDLCGSTQKYSTNIIENNTHNSAPPSPLLLSKDNSDNKNTKWTSQLSPYK